MNQVRKDFRMNNKNGEDLRPPRFRVWQHDYFLTASVVVCQPPPNAL